jgi:hypothetical protein
MLINGYGNNRTVETWKTRDGWIVHAAETRDPEYYKYNSSDSCPLVVVPRVFVGRK